MKKQLLKTLVLTGILSLQGFFLLNAQTTSEEIVQNLKNDNRVQEFNMEPSRETPSLIRMNPSEEKLLVDQTSDFLRSVLGFSEDTNFINESSISNNGVEVIKFQQYFKGIKVEHGIFKAMTKKGVVLSFTAEYYNLPPDLLATASLSEDAALQEGLNHIGATTYAWEYIETLEDSPEKTAAYEELYPKGELVFVDNYATSEIDIALAYKFNIYAAEPLSRDYVYVDANTGDILLVDAIIKHADGIHTKDEVVKSLESAKTTAPSPVFLTGKGDTRYAGNRNFDTSKDTNGNFVLNGVTPSGVENETLSYEGAGGLPLSIPALTMFAEPIADGDGDLLNPETADNNWTAAEHRKDNFSTTNIYPLYNERNNDDVALDAHWGAEVVLDYWKNKHNRFSYDDKGTKVVNYVHYGDAYDNAFWNGSAMTYGDGSYQGGTNPNGAFAPLTSMDVCAHEIGHGVCEFTANLVYQRESGAMNEGFSDIWAAAVEDYVLSEIDGSLAYDPWGIGEQIDERDGGEQPGEAGSRALRWMDDPKAAGDPDSYGGENWIDPECGTPSLANDQCGVHTNSGVLNKWYYFLVTGSGQNFSPGYQKQSADDQVTDGGNSYTVEGIGFDKASQITYIAETMLSPNAKFADMRETSILVAQTLYGIGSKEEESTTNAWHAVDIGEAYKKGDPNTIVFSASNVQVFSEENLINGCEDFNTYSVNIEGVEIAPSASISISVAGSTATLGEDFDLSAQDLTFNGSEIKTLELTVYDDAVIEGSETVVLSFVYNNELQKQEFAISDNDFAPRTGKEAFDLLEKEEFSSGLPADWSVVSIADGVNTWKVNGDLTATGKAYVTDGTTETPFYDQLSGSNTILRSPLINASGATDISVSFDWEAGGETDADPSILYDYGEFVFSLDGINYTSVQHFVGDAAGVAPASGTFTMLLNELDGKAFYLGWRWFNDTLVGTEFSMTIDNVHVTAIPAGIETGANEQATASVHVGNTIYFLSETNDALIAKIENASEDLGCVTMAIIEEGTGSKVFSNISTERPSKVFEITTENSQATYDLTLYFTDEELNAFDIKTDLIPLKVNSSNIDDADEKKNNFQLDGVLTDENPEDAFRAYTATFSGSGAVSIARDFEVCMSAPALWKTADLGITKEAGQLCYNNDVFEIRASGQGIDGKSDSFFFTYQELSGDGEIVAKVMNLENTAPNAKAGVMIRESLEAGAMMATTTIVSNPTFTGSVSAFETRRTSGSSIKSSEFTPTGIPKYLKLVRTGKEISSYVSENKEEWELLGKMVLNFSETVYIGLAATSNLEGVATSANFSEVLITEGGATASTKKGQQSEKITSEEEEEVSQFRVYPNPAKHILNMEVPDAKIVSVAVYNLLGKSLKTYEINSANNTAEINVADLLKGLYILKIYTQDGRVLDKRFFKE